MSLFRLILILFVFFGAMFICFLSFRGGVSFYCISNDACGVGGYCHAWFSEGSRASTPVPVTFFHPGYCVHQEENSGSLPPPV